MRLFHDSLSLVVVGSPATGSGVCQVEEITLQHRGMLAQALEQARAGLSEGGIPIGAVLVSGDGGVIGEGRNRRIQRESVILHAEMDALENAGRRAAKEYARCTMYTTLSPCVMCSGAILLYGVKQVVVGENDSFLGAEDLLRSRGVLVEVIDDRACRDIMRSFIAAQPHLWAEDIGEAVSPSA